MDTGDVPACVRLALLRSLYGSLAVYFSGVLATLSVSIVLAVRIGTPIFFLWAAMEIVIAAIRLPLLLACRRSIVRDRPGPVSAYALLSLLWAGGVGFGAVISVSSQDWVAALAACVSAAAMLGGICFRYYATPRLVAAMLVTMAMPASAACLLSGEPVLLVSGLLIPLYVVAMAGAAHRLHETMVKALCAEREERLRARRDPLTGLNNRIGFADAFDALPGEHALACFYIDLDGFKRVNDTLGHRAGDQLLIMVAERLRRATPDGTVLARPGGDEFIAVMACADRDTAERIGDQLAAAVAGQPYLIDGQGVFIGASVGAALRTGQDCEALVAAADEALYRAKVGSTGACVVANSNQPQSLLRACG